MGGSVQSLARVSGVSLSLSMHIECLDGESRALSAIS